MSLGKFLPLVGLIFFQSASTFRVESSGLPLDSFKLDGDWKILDISKDENKVNYSIPGNVTFSAVDSENFTMTTVLYYDGEYKETPDTGVITSVDEITMTQRLVHESDGTKHYLKLRAVYVSPSYKKMFLHSCFSNKKGQCMDFRIILTRYPASPEEIRFMKNEFDEIVKSAPSLLNPQ